MIWRESDSNLSIADFGDSVAISLCKFDELPQSSLYSPGYRPPDLYHDDMSFKVDDSMFGWDVFAWGTILGELVARHALWRPSKGSCEGSDGCRRACEDTLCVEGCWTPHSM